MVPLVYPVLNHVYTVYKCKQMSRTVSTRIPTKLHEELRERCNLMGESISDFVKASIEISLHNTCEFDFGDEITEELEKQQSEFKRKNGD